MSGPGWRSQSVGVLPVGCAKRDDIIGYEARCASADIRGRERRESRPDEWRIDERARLAISVGWGITRRVREEGRHHRIGGAMRERRPIRGRGLMRLSSVPE